MMYYNADVRKLSEAQIEAVVKEFTETGWELSGSFTHGENCFHQFVQFVWSKDSPPVAPDGYKID